MKKERTYDIIKKDFTPLIGALFYQGRNHKRNQEERKDLPRPYKEYLLIGVGICGVDSITALALVKSLESLLF